LKVHRYFFNRGSKSRNKVAVGEPAAGSFSDDQKKNNKKTKNFSDHSLEKENGLEKQNKTQSIVLFCRSSAPVRVLFINDDARRPLGARLSQRVAMDDLASYFVEERSKVR
jgi:hypothetical protein